MNEPKLFIFRGVPGAGKSTLALEYRRQYNAFIVSFDSIRSMFAGREDYHEIYTNYTNMIVADIADYSTHALVQQEKNIIIDNTNIHERDINRWRKMVTPAYQIFVVSVIAPLEDCLERNTTRVRKVPENVIKKFYDGFPLSEKYIKEQTELGVIFITIQN